MAPLLSARRAAPWAARRPCPGTRVLGLHHQRASALVQSQKPQIEHCELQSLLDMGLAFDDFNKLAANHPAYHPFGSLDSPGSVKPIMRFFYNDGSTSACWVVQAPCTLPNRLRLVRDLTGVLRFCLDCNLLPPNMNPVAPVETQRAKLGSVIIPLWKPPEIDETNRHVFSCNLANTLQEHLRHGDDTLAAELLDTHRDPLLTLCTFDEEKNRWRRRCALPRASRTEWTKFPGRVGSTPTAEESTL